MFDGQIRSWSLLGLVVRPRPVIPQLLCFLQHKPHTCFIEGLVTGH
jgi:hypothetical protein